MTSSAAFSFPFLGSEAVYGAPWPELAPVGHGAVQLSPFSLHGVAIESLPDGSLNRLVVAAPPGTLERRYTLAHGLRTLTPGGNLVVLAVKDKGGSRLRKELEMFGGTVNETARRHHRVCALRRPDAPVGLADAIADGEPRLVDSLNLWSQPGLFAWDRIDSGSALLLDAAPALAGRGADLGCGSGVLARAVLASSDVTALTLIDLDRRAVDLARRNIDDPRASFLQHDLRQPAPGLTDLDFVITNPPFHQGGDEDRFLGQAFIASAAAMLRRGGACWLVANIALPYEASLAQHFATVTPLARANGFKLFEARR